MSLVFLILYIIGLYSAYLCGSLFLRARSAQEERKTPYLTLVVVFLIAIPSTLQFFVATILPSFERDYARFLAGDWWRLVTSLFVQDGGISGTIFNLVSLALVGSVAEQLWSRPQWLLIFFAGGILSQFAGLLWQPVGAGNSVANFSLAASIAMSCLLRSTSQAVKTMGLLTLAAGGILLFLRDIHGAAMLIGSGTALILMR